MRLTVSMAPPQPSSAATPFVNLLAAAMAASSTAPAAAAGANGSAPTAKPGSGAGNGAAGEAGKRSAPEGGADTPPAAARRRLDLDTAARREKGSPTKEMAPPRANEDVDGGSEAPAKRPRVEEHAAVSDTPVRTNGRAEEPEKQKQNGVTNGQHEVEKNTSNGKVAPRPGSTPPAEKSREWKIIERATGMSFDALSDSLLSLDSLRHTKVASALRREAGKKLSRRVLQNAPTLRALLEEVARCPEEEAPTCSSQMVVARDERQEFATWGMMWQSRCQWTLHARKPIPEPVLRAALAKLVLRHVALRAELRDPYRLFNAVQQALSVAGCVQAHAKVGRPGRCLFWLGTRLARWAFKRTWPRVSCSSSKAVKPGVVTVWDMSTSFEEAEMKCWRPAAEFVPPFRAMLAPFKQEGGEEGVLIHLTVTHMLSDGYCIVPLLDDLANLIAQESPSPLSSGGASPGGGGGALHRALPPVPSMFEVMDRRIMQTIDGVDDGERLYPRITPHALSGKVWVDANMLMVTIPADVVRMIRQSASILAVPDDIVMLTLLGVTLTWFFRKSTETVAMIVPQRDGPGENDMVGLFSDVRNVSICTEGLSFAGVALRLHHIVKERLWTVPDLRTQFELTLLNFEWTDFQEKHGFRQHVSTFERAESSSIHPLRVAVDQPSVEVWRLRVAFEENRYCENHRELFFQLFHQSLCMLRDHPLELVWPAGIQPGGAEPTAKW